MAINGAGAAEREAQRVWNALDSFRIEVPSWGFANTGTRFGKFVQGGAATTIEEKDESQNARARAAIRLPIRAGREIRGPSGRDGAGAALTRFIAKAKRKRPAR